MLEHFDTKIQFQSKYVLYESLLRTSTIKTLLHKKKTSEYAAELQPCHLFALL